MNLTIHDPAFVADALDAVEILDAVSYELVESRRCLPPRDRTRASSVAARATLASLAAARIAGPGRQVDERPLDCCRMDELLELVQRMIDHHHVLDDFACHLLIRDVSEVIVGVRRLGFLD